MKNFFSQDLFSGNRSALAMVFLLVIAIYSNILANPFVFDDKSLIVENTAIGDIRFFFSQERLPALRAIVNLTFALNYKIGGFNVLGYHLVNILVHILNGCIVYFLMMAVLKQRPEVFHQSGIRSFQSSDLTIRATALFSTLIFVIHPIQTQAVTYTIQRYTSMAAMFYLGAMLFYAYARIAQREGKNPERETGPGVYYGLSILFGILAFLSKQNTASLPGAILLLEYLLFRPNWKEWKEKLPWLALTFILWFVFIVTILGLYISVTTDGNAFEDVASVFQETRAVSRWEYLCTQFNVLVIYIRLLFFPIGQNLDYMYPFKTGFFDGLTPFAFVFLCVVAGIGIYNIKKRPVISFSIFFFFITLSVESSIIPISDAMFEHRLYLPMLGFAFFSAYVFSICLRRQQRTCLFVFLLVVIFLGTATYQRNKVWQDSVRLWTDVLSKSPHNYRAYNNLGNIMMDKGENEKARHYYSEALKLEPRYWVTHNNLGTVLIAQLELHEAITSFKNALKLNPNYGDAHYNLANALSLQGRLKEAESHYLASLRLSPDDFEAHNNLAVLLAKQGKFSKARAHFQEAIRIKPDFDRAADNLRAMMETIRKTGIKTN